MYHRFGAMLVILCIALGGAGCAVINQKPSGEQVLMPRQTGSTLQRRVMVPTGSGATSATQRKKEPKKESKKKKPKKEEAKRAQSTPTPAPKRPPRQPEEEPDSPDRFR